MVTDGSPGNRKIARNVGNAIAILGQAMKDGPLGLLKRAGILLRDTASMPFLDALAQQARDMVPPERLESADVKTALAEVVDDLQENAPDPRRLELLRRAFLGIAIGDPKDQDGSVGLAFLDTARSLSGLQARILGAVLRTPVEMDRRLDGTAELRAETWMNAVRVASGIPFMPVLRRELLLLGRALLVSVGVDETRFDSGWPQYGGGSDLLTDYGRAFCEFLQRAEPFPDAPSTAQKDAGAPL